MTYFIGIDIAKYKHNCFIMDQDGFVIRDSFSFSNDRAEPVLTYFFLSWILWDPCRNESGEHTYNGHTENTDCLTFATFF